MDEQVLPDDFKEFLRLLNDAEVRYLLIGGYALGYHGYPRATTDIHIKGTDPDPSDTLRADPSAGLRRFTQGYLESRCRARR